MLKLLFMESLIGGCWVGLVMNDLKGEDFFFILLIDLFGFLGWMFVVFVLCVFLFIVKWEFE